MACFMCFMLKKISEELVGNSMSNHPIFLDVDTLTSPILFIFSACVDNFEIINPWKLYPLNSIRFQSYWDLKVWPKRVFRVKIHHFELTFSVITIVLVIPSSWNLVWVIFWGWEIQKLHLEDLKTNQS